MKPTSAYFGGRPTQRRDRTAASRGFRFIILAAMIAMVVFATLSFIQVRPPTRVVPIRVTTSSWEPYLSEDLPGNGPLARIAVDVFQNAGYDPELTFTSWTLAQKYVDQGAALAVVAMVRSAERDEKFLYSDPILEITYSLYRKTDTPERITPSTNDLSGYRIGVIDGYEYWPELTNSGATLITFRTTKEAFSSLATGEIDLVAEDKRAAQAVIQNPEFNWDASLFEEVHAQSTLTTSTQTLHILARNSPEGESLLKSFNNSLADYVNSPEFIDNRNALDSSKTRVIVRTHHGTANLYSKPNEDNPIGVTPTGTHGFVHSWANTGKSASDKVGVKLADGPWAGRVVYIRIEELEVQGA